MQWSSKRIETSILGPGVSHRGTGGDAIHAEDIRWSTGLELEHNQLMRRDYLTYTGPYRYLLRLALQLCATTALASLIGCAPSALAG